MGVEALALLLLALGVGALIWRRHGRPRPFPPWLTPLLHTRRRRRTFAPEAAADRHGLAPGMRVLEIGPGDGYLTGAALDRLGPEGRLVCLDVQYAMLRKLRHALAPRPVVAVCASGSVLPFRDGEFDCVYLCHVLGEIPDRSGALRECLRILRPGGILALTEGLPDPDFLRNGRVLAMAESVGFHRAERYGGALHYTQRFRRP